MKTCFALTFSSVTAALTSTVSTAEWPPSMRISVLSSPATEGRAMAKLLESEMENVAHHSLDGVPQSQKFILRGAARQKKMHEPNLTLNQEIDHRKTWFAAQKRFDAASSRSESEFEAKVKAGLTKAFVEGEVKMGKADRQVFTSVPASCEPNFALCPDGWRPQDASCVADASYVGECARKLDILTLTVEEKIAMGQVCGLSWRCRDKMCEEDFSGSCPERWAEIEEGLCEAPVTYSGGCSRILNAAAMSDKDKLAYSIRCRVGWPCRTMHDVRFIARDYSALCPHGWSKTVDETEQLCIGPPDYHGCFNVQNFNGWTRQEKQLWARLCDAPWTGA